MKEYVDIEKIEKMGIAGDILSNILKKLSDKAGIGVRLDEIDDLAETLCKQNGVLPAFKGYENFPKAVCIGVNNVVVHGIPNEDTLKDGDIVSIDMGIKYQDVYSDCAVTVGVGKISANAQKLLEITKKAAMDAIKEAKPGKRVGDLGFAMQNAAESNGFSVVREMTGHGIGTALHEEPYIPCYGIKGQGERLYEGQTLAIEAIVNEGSPDIRISRDDGWTSTTKDGMLSALFEHTIVVGKQPQILTRW
ncbi:type I methionyl aminopeptidase [bacterium]|nr:type I methionyl aminopeptidase [bacterium]